MAKNTHNLIYLYYPYVLNFVFAVFFWISTILYFAFPELKPYTDKETNFSIAFGVYFVIVFVVVSVFIFHDGDKWNSVKYYEYLLGFIIASSLVNIGLMAWSVRSLGPSEQFKSDLNNSVYHYEQDVWPLNIENLQRELQCCGYINVKDYLKGENAERLDHRIPLSCCDRKDVGRCSKFEAFRIGCLDAYDHKIDFYRKAIYATSGISLSIQLVAILLIIYYFDAYEVILDKDLPRHKNLTADNIVWINPAQKKDTFF